MRSDLENRGRILSFTIIGADVGWWYEGHDAAGSIEYAYQVNL
jgi:hypothetical protein